MHHIGNIEFIFEKQNKWHMECEECKAVIKPGSWRFKIRTYGYRKTLSGYWHAKCFFNFLDKIMAEKLKTSKLFKKERSFAKGAMFGLSLGQDDNN